MIFLRYSGYVHDIRAICPISALFRLLLLIRFVWASSCYRPIIHSLSYLWDISKRHLHVFQPVFSSAHADIISTVRNLVISNVDFYKGIKIKFLRRDVSRYFWLYFIMPCSETATCRLSSELFCHSRLLQSSAAI